MVNNWHIFLRKYREKDPNLPYREALKEASIAYKKLNENKPKTKEQKPKMNSLTKEELFKIIFSLKGLLNRDKKILDKINKDLRAIRKKKVTDNTQRKYQELFEKKDKMTKDMNVNKSILKAIIRNYQKLDKGEKMKIPTERKKFLMNLIKVSNLKKDKVVIEKKEDTEEDTDEEYVDKEQYDPEEIEEVFRAVEPDKKLKLPNNRNELIILLAKIKGGFKGVVGEINKIKFSKNKKDIKRLKEIEKWKDIYKKQFEQITEKIKNIDKPTKKTKSKKIELKDILEKENISEKEYIKRLDKAIIKKKQKLSDDLSLFEKNPNIKNALLVLIKQMDSYELNKISKNIMYESLDKLFRKYLKKSQYANIINKTKVEPKYIEIDKANNLFKIWFNSIKYVLDRKDTIEIQNNVDYQKLGIDDYNFSSIKISDIDVDAILAASKKKAKIKEKSMEKESWNKFLKYFKNKYSHLSNNVVQNEAKKAYKIFKEYMEEYPQLSYNELLKESISDYESFEEDKLWGKFSKN